MRLSAWQALWVAQLAIAIFAVIAAPLGPYHVLAIADLIAGCCGLSIATLARLR